MFRHVEGLRLKVLRTEVRKRARYSAPCCHDPRAPLMTTPGRSPRAPIIIRSFWFSLKGRRDNAGALPQPYSFVRPVAYQ